MSMRCRYCANLSRETLKCTSEKQTLKSVPNEIGDRCNIPDAFVRGDGIVMTNFEFDHFMNSAQDGDYEG